MNGAADRKLHLNKKDSRDDGHDMGSVLEMTAMRAGLSGVEWKWNGRRKRSSRTWKGTHTDGQRNVDSVTLTFNILNFKTGRSYTHQDWRTPC